MVGFYSTFVFQSLWNWFVAGALNVQPVWYWQMYGMNLLVQLVTEPNTFTDEARWKQSVLLMVLSAVPTDKKEAVDAEMKSQDDSVWLLGGVALFNKVAGYSGTLAIGWLVHIFVE